ncbi:hypothetical protein PTSG_06017 [Salpingoeca rosetta]|uniref:Crossover junction endonuclease MUS81 n=1 Tax=Salpingoeca rosetta (strain ATCC 50818 / BSB-021) TaxID=946362 RepID=F2UDF7_SALR5|nr:uncharacterized protein PTSG_06017 [Salpingoeca rosetta]EGD74652.1 hypothetical protein PTSG_06017 [Salpingoeca rosetta]|eukprot:XP_004992909.1 hypothetical protein PTSG_06017 [Salpingoeca rosetta]
MSRSQVERKRFDDFAQSIMYRGRLSSQLHRFYSMEVSHPVLLVEEGQLHVPGIDEARLKQATFNIQVEGGFFVKTVPNIREVEAYLVLCTRMIKQLVQGCSVEAWTPTERMCCHLRGFAGWGQPKDGHVHSFDFQTFQEISRRAATGTIREVFAHQLLHMNGLTLKHAQMITQAYPTPALFTNALREAHAATMHMSSLEDRKPNSSSARGGDNSTVFSPSSASATAAPATTTAAATTPTAASPSTLASGLKRRSSSAKTKTALDAFWDSLSTSEGKIGLAVRAKLQAYYLPRS